MRQQMTAHGSSPMAHDYYNDRLTLMTTTDMSADEIHDLGLAEVARIHDEMRTIMTQVDYAGTLQDFFDFTRTDPNNSSSPIPIRAKRNIWPKRPR
jgi:uncharacterized protein (DUF885 family)